MSGKTVTELVSEKAETAPDALALSSSSRTLTYRELDTQANRLANYLVALGVGPDVLVGVCLDRSPAMVIASLAIMKAGGAYVPFDPDCPRERLRFMLEDAQAPVLITHQGIIDRIGSGSWKTVDIERDALQISSQSEARPQVSVSGGSLAYVIYTSGSTGRPKGVEITHSSLLNLISWHQRAFDISPADRASQLANVGFDAAVWEVWPSLTAGSSVHFPDDAIRVAPKRLRDWLAKEQITVCFAPTPLAEALLILDWPKEVALRLLLTGGDTLHHHPPSGLPFALVNNYGPTECTVVATSGPVLPNAHPDGPPPIGRPVDNFQIYILDEQLQRVPDGTVGELHIGGKGLARGYLSRPDLTAERFVANPFSQVANDRIYKTGDLARYLPDGQIAFVGRVDEQIKVRGYRIEPEEIATVLEQFPGVEASLIVARKDSSGDPRLIAYVVPSADAKLDHSSLQEYLSRYLPDYMVPAAFVRIPALPLGPNGKIDRAALPLHDAGNAIGDEARIAPSTPVEERVVAILAELLRVEKVSINDNFFSLGGHSLLGTQLIARVRDFLGVELPLRAIFDSPTVAELSAEIERMLGRDRLNAAD
ncbi:MAG: non-ribosomal peptide synthetase [Terriglobales bacterium]